MAREKTQQQRRRPGGPQGQIRRRNCFFCKEHIAEVWPGLRLVIHGGTKFDPYRQLFREQIVPDVPVYER